MATKRTMSAQNKKRMARNANAMDTLGGFTIIEVVLVLAIAGLIFLMVFIALPQLQRAQRDTQRRDDLAKISNAITQFQTNNNGRLPAASSVAPVEPGATGNVDLPTCTTDAGASTGDACRLVKVYLNSVNAARNEFVDPDGPSYGITIQAGTEGWTPTNYDHIAYILTRARCNGEVATVNGANARDYAVMYMLEGNGIYCQDNG